MKATKEISTDHEVVAKEVDHTATDLALQFICFHGSNSPSAPWSDNRSWRKEKTFFPKEECIKRKGTCGRSEHKWEKWLCTLGKLDNGYYEC